MDSVRVHFRSTCHLPGRASPQVYPEKTTSSRVIFLTINQTIQVTGPSQDDYNRTFVINDEDHTLGNALKHVIMQNPAVEFCGYTVPHPMEKKIHVRVQTSDTPALQVLLQALKDLKKQNEEVKKKIEEAVQRYREAHPPPDTEAD